MTKKNADCCMADFEPDEVKYVLEPGRELTSLESWYRDNRLKPFDQFTSWDVSRAITQRICFEQLIPIAIKLLQANPMAGEWYEGDLIDSMRKVPVSYWQAHSDQRDAMRIICNQVVQHEDYKQDKTDMDRVLAELKKNIDAGQV